MTDVAKGRYAIYFFPDPETPLARHGQGWLGKSVTDIAAGAPRPPADLPPDVSADLWREATKAPRHYGFHGTLKAPFRLAAGERRETLEAATAALASSVRPFALPRLKVTDLAGFLALCLSEPSPAMDRLARRCVIELDRFRAPLSDAELSRRRPERLTVRQRAHLDRWGYPYVDEDFLFHMTLTGNLPGDVKEVLLPVLLRRMAPVCARPQTVDRLSLFHQAEPEAPFILVRQFPFEAIAG